MGCGDSAKAGSVSFEALTFDVQERRSHTLILCSAQTTEVRRDSDRQNNPPHSILVLDIVPKPFEEEQKGRFDTPETGVEEYNYSNGSVQVLFRLLFEIGRRRIELSGSDCDVLI